jgi:uncharacterized membrane protein
MPFLLTFLIGALTGLRSMTSPAVTAWAAHLGWLHLDEPLSFIGSGASVAVFTVLAIGELVVDKLPKTPRRTEPLGLGARFVFGGLCGACVSSTPLVGACLGAIGGLVGAFAGYQARTRLVKALGLPDIVVALAEDCLAIGGCLWVVSRG